MAIEQLKIRTSNEGDREQILSLAEAMQDDINLEKKRERLTKAIGSPEMLVAEADGEFAGFMYVYFKAPGDFAYSGADELHISALAVAPKFHEHGIDEGVAKGLVTFILGKTDKPITTDVANEDTARISIFTDAGFTITSQGPDQVYMEYVP